MLDKKGDRTIQEFIVSVFILVSFIFVISALVVSKIASADVYSSKKIGDTENMLHELSQLRWKNRILVVFTRSEYKNILEMLKVEEVDLKERHIIWLVVHNEKIYSNYSGELSEALLGSVQKLYSKGDTTMNQQIVLLGKDGGVKDRDSVLDFDGLYGLIDGMPMRQSEMRRQ